MPAVMKRVSWPTGLLLSGLGGTDTLFSASQMERLSIQRSPAATPGPCQLWAAAVGGGRVNSVGLLGATGQEGLLGEEPGWS